MADKKNLKSKLTPAGLVVTIPQALRASLAQREGVVIKITTARG
jgi:hypothetical protein